MNEADEKALAELRARIVGSDCKVMMCLDEFTDNEGNPLPLMAAIKAGHALLDQAGFPKATKH